MIIGQSAIKITKKSFSSQPLHSLVILNAAEMHLALMLRPILVLRIPSLMVTLRKLSLLPPDGHTQDCLLRIFNIVTHCYVERLSP